MGKNKYNGLDIAVIGISCKFPKSRNIDEFWDNLKEGRELISFYSDCELIESGVSAEQLKNPNYIKAQGFLEDSDCFDAYFFGYTNPEAEVMDPQIRLFHEHSWKALEDSGYIPQKYKGVIGLYAGANKNISHEILCYMKDKADWNTFPFINKDFLTSLVSYKLDLKGPSYSIYSACSTSLVAISHACTSLFLGQCDIALAGGVSIIQDKTGYIYQEGMIASSDGHNRTFDEKATGTVSGSGVGVVVLKRLKDAIKDHDRIYAVVKGCAVNNDGSLKIGFTAPSIAGQTDVIKLAHKIAKIETESISYIECHGTATNLGDPIEVEALKLGFNSVKRNICGLGSVKTNIGHTDTAAGVAGFIKTVLCLHNRTLVQSLHYKKPNPKIDFIDSPFYVVTETKEWKNVKYPLRAGVTSLGIGGTNAHVVLEEAPKKESFSEGRKYKILLLTGKTKTALENNYKNLKEYLRNHPKINLADVAYTLQVGRADFNNKKMIICKNTSDAINKMELNDPSSTIYRNFQPKIVFLFPGQGSQYVNMGRDLYENEKYFKDTLDECFKIAIKFIDVNLKEVIYPLELKNESKQNIDQTQFTQPVLFIFEYALAKLLMNWGIKPDCMIGHSIGEFTAACISDVINFEDALKLIAYRGKLMQKTQTGTMLSIQISEERLIPLLDQNISLAAVNSTGFCVVAGEDESIMKFSSKTNEIGIDSKIINTSYAFHSSLMDPILDEFENALSFINFKNPKIPYVSNITGDWITEDVLSDNKYWSKHLRQTVQFSRGLETIFSQDNLVLIEVGAGNALSFFANNHIKRNNSHSIQYLLNNKTNTNQEEYFYYQLGQLWLQGVKINWESFSNEEVRYKISLPTYEFDKISYKLKSDYNNLLKDTKSCKNNENEIKNVIDWFYVPVWKQNRCDVKHDIFTCSWLIFKDEYGFSNLIIDILKRKQNNVFIVLKGDFFVYHEELQVYEINPSSQNDYDKLFDHLKKKKNLPNKILHLWSLSQNDNEEMSIGRYNLIQDVGLYSLMNICKSIGNLGIASELNIITVTNGVNEVIGDEILVPEKSTILGAIKIIPTEYKNINCKNIDITDHEFENENLANRIIEESFEENGEIEICFRNNIRWIKSFENVNLKSKKNIIRKDGTYIITGGMGGMGFTLAEYFCKSHNANIILIGRSFFPERINWNKWISEHCENDETCMKIKKIQEMEVNGGRIKVICGDISDITAMKKFFKEIETEFGSINGIIHAAGVADYEGVIQKRTKEETEKITNPKIKGVLVIDNLVSTLNLDFIVLFSSLGNQLYKHKFGQIGYNAANEFLDSYSYYKNRYNKCAKIITINWCDWSEVGMSVKAMKKRELTLENDLEALKCFEGVEVFKKMLSSQLPQIIVSKTDLDMQIKLMNQINFSVIESVELNKSERQNYERPDLDTPYKEPIGDTERNLEEIWKSFFQLKQIGLDDDFFDIGGDSLKALFITNRIHKMYSIKLNLSDLYTKPTIRKLSKHIENITKMEFELSQDNGNRKQVEI